jgi:uncharacterized protein YndB with AHSA1/START domain
VKLAVQQLVIRADADRVFDMLIDPVLFVSWTAEDATLEPTPGGVVRWTHPNGDTVSGRYIIIDRPRRLVFTYGWERIDVGTPPGSTQVEITLTAQPDGSILVKLVHSGLRDRAADAHRGGWAHYLERLRRSAEGRHDLCDRAVPRKREVPPAPPRARGCMPR